MFLNASVCRGLVSGIIAGLAGVFFVGLGSTTHNTALAAVRPSGGEHRIVFAYWTEEEGFASSVVLNNASAAPLIVRPTLHASDGIRRIEVEPVNLPARHHQRFEIKEWLTLSGASAPFGSGSLSLAFDAPYPSFLGAQVTIVKSSASLSFDVPPLMPAAFASTRLEGLLWLGSGTDSRIALTNTSNASVTIEALLTANELPAVTRQITLSALETRVIRTDQLGAPVGPYDRSTQVGGISLSHSGRPGDIVALGLISRPDVGSSTQVPFDDPATRQSNRLVATHVPVGLPDVAGYPTGTQFKAVAVLRNSAPDAIDVATTVSYVGPEGHRSQVLEVRHLESREISIVDLNAELRRLGSTGPLRGVGVTFRATGDSGSLLGHLVSVDNSGTHVFTVPLKDPLIAMNRSGNYPWSIEGADESVVFVRNTSDQESRFTIQLDHADGSYTLPLQVIAPQQEIAIDIRRLRDDKIPDSLDRMLPENLAVGRAVWFESGPQALIGRLEIRNVAAGTVNSFSCGGPTCPCAPDSMLVTVNSNQTTGIVGGTTKSRLFETRSDDCGNIFGPYDVTNQTGWSSSNTNVISVGALTPTGVITSNVGPGTANLVANYSGSDFSPNPDSGTGCQFSAILLSDSQAMTVNPGASFGFVDAIGKDVAVDVYVFLDPSPSAVSVTLTLEPVPGMGTGSAKFDVNNSTSLTVTQSGNVKIKGVTPSSMLDNMRIRASANGLTIATETFTVVQVTLSIRTGGSSVVSMDNSARGYYNSELGTFNLNTYKSSGAAPAKIWRTGVEVVATVIPSSYTGLVIQERQVVAFKRFDGTNALQASGGPFPDPGDPGLRDDDPQSNASGGKTFDLDAPGLNLSAFPVGTTLRIRTNFIQWAKSAQGYRLSADFSWYSRLSVNKTASGEVLQTSVANDNKAGAGTTNLTWNLQ